MANRRWDSIFQDVLRDVIGASNTVRAGKSQSVGSERETLEVLNHKFTLSNPRDRILWNPIRKFNLFGAIARFFWMLSGSDRLKDIAFYEPKVLGFSDDAVSVPGSNYGTRLFIAEPGLDQIRAITQRLRDEEGSRRAVAVIYRPEDAVRESRDIPCAFGLGFHARAGRLNMTMIMRSNAAWTLLPYNLFEFSLLGELVSVMAGLPVGDYTHFALSMHIYKAGPGRPDEVAQAESAIRCSLGELPDPMPPMPKTTFDDLKRIHQWEAEIRYDAKGIGVMNYREYIRKCVDNCEPYWAQLALPLLAYVLLTQGKTDEGGAVLENVQEPLRRALIQHPLVAAPKVPQIEEDPILLESRLNLLHYSQEAKVDESWRELLWHDYYGEFKDGATQTLLQHERRRHPPLTRSDWGRRDREKRDRTASEEREPLLPF